MVIFLWPSVVLADGFTGEQFLTWSRDAQESLVRYSVTMTGLIAAQSRTEIANCVGDWYSDDEGVQAQRNEIMIGAIRDNPSYHPQAVVLAVIQKKCGSFSN